MAKITFTEEQKKLQQYWIGQSRLFSICDLVENYDDARGEDYISQANAAPRVGVMRPEEAEAVDFALDSGHEELKTLFGDVDLASVEEIYFRKFSNPVDFFEKLTGAGRAYAATKFLTTNQFPKPDLEPLYRYITGYADCVRGSADPAKAESMILSREEFAALKKSIVDEYYDNPIARYALTASLPELDPTAGPEIAAYRTALLEDLAEIDTACSEKMMRQTLSCDFPISYLKQEATEIHKKSLLSSKAFQTSGTLRADVDSSIENLQYRLCCVNMEQQVQTAKMLFLAHLSTPLEAQYTEEGRVFYYYDGSVTDLYAHGNQVTMFLSYADNKHLLDAVSSENHSQLNYGTHTRAQRKDNSAFGMDISAGGMRHFAADKAQGSLKNSGRSGHITMEGHISKEDGEFTYMQVRFDTKSPSVRENLLGGGQDARMSAFLSRREMPEFAMDFMDCKSADLERVIKDFEDAYRGMLHKAMEASVDPSMSAFESEYQARPEYRKEVNPNAFATKALLEQINESLAGKVMSGRGVYDMMQAMKAGSASLDRTLLGIKYHDEKEQMEAEKAAPAEKAYTAAEFAHVTAPFEGSNIARTAAFYENAINHIRVGRGQEPLGTHYEKIVDAEDKQIYNECVQRVRRNLEIERPGGLGMFDNEPAISKAMHLTSSLNVETAEFGNDIVRLMVAKQKECQKAIQNKEVMKGVLTVEWSMTDRRISRALDRAIRRDAHTKMGVCDSVRDNATAQINALGNLMDVLHNPDRTLTEDERKELSHILNEKQMQGLDKALETRNLPHPYGAELAVMHLEKTTDWISFSDGREYSTSINTLSRWKDADVDFLAKQFDLFTQAMQGEKDVSAELGMRDLDCFYINGMPARVGLEKVCGIDKVYLDDPSRLQSHKARMMKMLLNREANLEIVTVGEDLEPKVRPVVVSAMLPFNRWRSDPTAENKRYLDKALQGFSSRAERIKNDVALNLADGGKYGKGRVDVEVRLIKGADGFVEDTFDEKAYRMAADQRAQDRHKARMEDLEDIEILVHGENGLEALTPQANGTTQQKLQFMSDAQFAFKEQINELNFCIGENYLNAANEIYAYENYVKQPLREGETQELRDSRMAMLKGRQAQIKEEALEVQNKLLKFVHGQDPNTLDLSQLINQYQTRATQRDQERANAMAARAAQAQAPQVDAPQADAPQADAPQVDAPQINAPQAGQAAGALSQRQSAGPRRR